MGAIEPFSKIEGSIWPLHPSKGAPEQDLEMPTDLTEGIYDGGAEMRVNKLAPERR